jgi:hypothetical protein
MTFMDTVPVLAQPHGIVRENEMRIQSLSSLARTR